MSKVFRLNQAPAGDAAKYLGNLGAKIQVTQSSVTTNSALSVASTGGGSSNETTTTSESSAAYGAGVGPLLGLIGTVDTRLNTITLIGDCN